MKLRGGGIIRTGLLACIISVGLLAVDRARADIGLNIQDDSTTYSASDVWVSFSTPGGAYTGSSIELGATYNGGTQLTVGTYVLNSDTFNNALSNPIQLSTIESGSFDVSSLVSEAIYVSYGTAFQDLTAAPGFFSNSVSGTIPFQNVELTYTGQPGDQANLTNINYFTAPTSMTSYTSNGTVIQSTGFTKSTAQVATQLASLAPGTNVVTGAGGQVLRYIGPSTYIGTSTSATYQSFVPYLQTVAASTINNNIVNNSAFNSVTGTSEGYSTYTNYNFTFLYTSTVAADGSIVLSGSIQNVANVYGGSTGGLVSSSTTYFSNAGVTISASNTTSLNAIIYGQTASGTLSSAVTYNGASGTTTGWGAFNNFIVTSGTTPGSGIENSGAYNILQAQVIGEITSGIQMGFLGNSGTVTFNGTATVLDTMNSDQWWQISPLQAFNEIQSGSGNYNPWGNAIYGDSFSYAIGSGTTDSNGVYGIPYSDRLGQGPLVNTTQYTESGSQYNVSYIDVGFGDPTISAVPEPGTFAYVVIAFAGLAGLATYEVMKRRKPALQEQPVAPVSLRD